MVFTSPAIFATFSSDSRKFHVFGRPNSQKTTQRLLLEDGNSNSRQNFQTIDLSNGRSGDNLAPQGFFERMKNRIKKIQL